MTMTRTKAIERLRRRANFLHERVEAAGPAVDQRGRVSRAAKLSFDASERSALNYAIDHLERCPLPREQP